MDFIFEHRPSEILWPERSHDSSLIVINLSSQDLSAHVGRRNIIIIDREHSYHLQLTIPETDSFPANSQSLPHPTRSGNGPLLNGFQGQLYDHSNIIVCIYIIYRYVQFP
jgi:hypothetical protein